MEISPDSWIIYDWGGWRLTATVVFTWVVMAILVFGSWAVTARLSEGEKVSRWQVMLEVIVAQIREQIGEVGAENEGYLRTKREKLGHLPEVLGTAGAR